MLKGINPILTGDLLKVLSDMGHGDEIVIADGNFASTGDSRRQPPIWVPSNDTVEVLDAILEVFPVEHEEDAIQYIVETYDDAEPPPRQATIPAPFFGRADLRAVHVSPLSRREFHERAREAYAIVATTDPRHYFCYILRKGALPDPTAENERSKSESLEETAVRTGTSQPPSQ